MTCPRCGLADVEAPSCPRCGVVFAKLGAATERRQKPRPAAAAAPPPPPPAPDRSGGISPAALILGALLLGGAAWYGLARMSSTTTHRTAVVTEARPSSSPSAAAPLPVLPTPPSRAPGPSAAPLEQADGLSAEDAKRANALVERLNARRPTEESDLTTAEELVARYPKEEKLGDMLTTVLVSLAGQERSQRRFTEAQARLRRAIGLRPRGLGPRLLLVGLLIEVNDFAGAETAAREAIAIESKNAELWYALAYTLFRQDKNREAIEAAQTSLQVQENEPARTLLAQLIKTQQDEQRMAERQLAHFHVRYDGESHEDVGREILQALERHYATLVRTLDHQPSTTIPVTLFSREQYVEASGAPIWSGGVYDSVDGRIRIPIGGLTRSLTSGMDQTLIHELTHAFLADKTRGVIQHASPVNEGFAQYMEGNRAGSDLSGERLTNVLFALPALHPQQCGNIGCVQGFYLGGLAFVEYLVGLRGVGGMNDLFGAMGETGSVDEAFRRVYGQDYAATRRGWRQRLER